MPVSIVSNGGQSSSLIVGECLQTVNLHVSPLQLPLVVMFPERRSA
jgi:hypothetical protein